VLLGLPLAVALPVVAGGAPQAPAPGPKASAAAAPAFRTAGEAATRGRARSLRIRPRRRVTEGDVMVAGIAVRTRRARRILPPAGWRLVRADRAGRLVQAIFLRVAGTSEPRTYRWRFRRRAAAAGGLVAYRRVDRERPLAAPRARAVSSRLAVARRASRRRVSAPRLRTRAADTRVVGFFATAGRRRLAAPRGMRRRYAMSSRLSSAAAFDFVKSRAGATGRRVATARCARARRCRGGTRAIGRLVALRPARAGGDGRGLGSPPPPRGLARGRLPSPLPESTGAVFYVSTVGSDSNPGSAAAPWRTIQKALDTLQPNQKALVRGGTYVENLHMSRAGTASGPISVEAHPGEDPILQSAGSHPLEVSSEGGWFRFRGLTIQDSPGTSGGNVDVYGHHVEISSNEIRQSRDQGIYTDEESQDVYVLGNWIHHNGQGIQHQSHGIYLQGNNHLVSTNVIHDHPEGFGIQVYDKNSGSIVVNNTVVASGYSGIVIGGSGGVDNIRVHNNIFAFNDQWGIKHDSDCPSSTLADHNVIWANGYEPVEEGCPGLDTSGGNVLADPRFVNLAARNLHLGPGSAALNQGLAAWALPVDFEGDARPQGAAPDAGAYEDG
jgi:parallel beta helix pectate lyase-like protein